MIRIAKDDVLRGLKRCKRIAKQDLLASSLTDNPQYWNEQAQVRRNYYDLLMQVIEQGGVEQAYNLAVRQYAALPPCNNQDIEQDPNTSGTRQALEVFFSILGMSKKDALKARRDANLAWAGV